MQIAVVLLVGWLAGYWCSVFGGRGLVAWRCWSGVSLDAFYIMEGAPTRDLLPNAECTTIRLGVMYPILDNEPHQSAGYLRAHGPYDQ